MIRPTKIHTLNTLCSLPGVAGGVVGVAVEGGEQDPSLGRVAPRAARHLILHNVRHLADDVVLLVLDASAVQVHLDK